jgi:pimeloyl-ACP methyl ester carboxylesterase
MRGRRDHWSKAGACTVALALLVVGAVVAQDPAPPAKGAAAPGNVEKDKGKAPAKKGGRLLRAPARVPAKGAPRGADPLVNAPNADGTPLVPGQPMPLPGTFHLRFKIAVGEIEPLSAAYYLPKSGGNSSPVVLLIHERERSSKDFEESIAELKKYTFAEELQKQGYAVLALDLRGHGASTPRRSLAKADWPPVVNDLQAAYYCLVDRHNRDELNLAKLGVVALGEGANVASTWAAMGGGVSSEGRASDLGALVLVSPMVEAQDQGLPAKRAISALAARVKIDLLAGERDAASAGLVDDGPASVKAIVKRYPANKVETFPSALHGYKLLQFEPGMTTSVFQFLEATIKSRADEWDGRYLMNPIAYSDVKLIKNPVRVDPNAATKKAAN